MQQLLQTLRQRLKMPLPHRLLEEEGLDENLLQFISQHQLQATQPDADRPPRKCAVLINLFKDHDEVVKILFIQRPPFNKVHPNEIAFPGGGVEKQDKNLEATAIRENFEEVGFLVPSDQVLGYLSEIYIPPSNSLITPVVAYLNHPPSIKSDPKEVACVHALPLHALQHNDNQRLHFVPLSNGTTLPMPAFYVEDVLIWGGTARIIRELNKILTT